MTPIRTIIMGAAGRDFHNFNVFFRGNQEYQVVAFTDFYNDCPVLSAEEPVRSGRLRLVAAARQSIANALALLGITAPEAM